MSEIAIWWRLRFSVKSSHRRPMLWTAGGQWHLGKHKGFSEISKSMFRLGSDRLTTSTSPPLFFWILRSLMSRLNMPLQQMGISSCSGLSWHMGCPKPWKRQLHKSKVAHYFPRSKQVADKPEQFENRVQEAWKKRTGHSIGFALASKPAAEPEVGDTPTANTPGV